MMTFRKVKTIIKNRSSYKLIMKWKKMSRYGMKLALNQMEAPKKLISLDVGTISTGVGISCSNLHKSYVHR